MNSESPFLVLAADTFTPLSTSGAIQLHDLAASLSHTADLLVIAPHQGFAGSFALDEENGFRVLRVTTPPTKDVNYFRRVMGELLMPFFMWRAIQKTSYRNRRCAGIIWYSPTIFLGPLVAKLKRLHGCRSYLILRDLFPDWAVDAGVMRKGPAYRVLKWVESYQYRQADVIGVQTPANLPHLAPWDDGSRRIEVLPNWLAPAVSAPCSLDVSQTALAGRRIFVYAGNMGVAQDMQLIIDMAASMRSRSDWGFLFVGRGSETEAICRRIAQDGLDNVVLCDEIQPQEIPGLFAQCHVGIVALDPRHTTHNIPGKFIAYMRSGLPVLARVNRGNDLTALINQSRVGVAVDDPGLDALIVAASTLTAMTADELALASARAKALWEAEYSAESCAAQISAGLSEAVVTERTL